MKGSSVKKIKNAKVVKGKGRGKRFGIATVNFDPKHAKDLREGIYVCRILSDNRKFWGVLHFGPRPTFGEKSKSFEVHLFDFDDTSSLVDKADIEIYDFVRQVINFESTKDMIERIEEDIKIAKEKILSLEGL